MADEPTLPLAHHVAVAIAPLRRQFIADALDGLIFQAEGAMRFLDRADDACAAAAMARLFDFARQAAAEMRELRGEAVR